MKLSAKFRERDGIPFAIKKPTSTQYRYGDYDKVFYHRNELEKHLKIEKKNLPIKKLNFPKFNEKIEVNLYYYQDTREATLLNFEKFKKRFE